MTTRTSPASRSRRRPSERYGIQVDDEVAEEASLLLDGSVGDETRGLRRPTRNEDES